MGYKLVCVWNTDKPPKEGWYLVTEKDGSIEKVWFDGVNWVVQIPDGNWYRNISVEVLAWSELPEPYKEITLDRTE